MLCFLNLLGTSSWLCDCDILAGQVILFLLPASWPILYMWFQSGSALLVSWLVRGGDELAPSPTSLFDYLWISVTTGSLKLLAWWRGLSCPATFWVLSGLLQVQTVKGEPGEGRAGRPWERGISGMASQSQFPGSVVPGAQRDVCYAFGWSIPPPLLNFTSFFPEGLFYCAFRIFLFFCLAQSTDSCC